MSGAPSRLWGGCSARRCARPRPFRTGWAVGGGMALPDTATYTIKRCGRRAPARGFGSRGNRGAPRGQGIVYGAMNDPADTRRRDCDASAAICTSDGRKKLSNSLSAAVAGPVGISVADARVGEGAGARLAFAVTLSRAASGTGDVPDG